MSPSLRLTINGEARDVALEDPRVTLLDLLRERLGLPGTKKGCDRGQCGACTVLVDGRRVNSCLILAATLDGASVVTIEGLATGDRLHPVQAAFIEQRRLPVRLLHAGPDHERGRPDRRGPGGRRSRTHPRGDERQHLPLRRLSRDHPRGAGPRCATWPSGRRTTRHDTVRLHPALQPRSGAGRLDDRTPPGSPAAPTSSI